MLNEEKVILMSKMAIYEKNQGKRDFKVNKYFRTDYVGLNMINTAIMATLLYIIFLAAIVIVNIEKILLDIASIDLLAVGRTALIWYILFMVAYLIIAFVVYSLRYQAAKKQIKDYDENLRKLYKIYKEERKAKVK